MPSLNPQERPDQRRRTRTRLGAVARAMKVGFIGLGTMGNHMAHNLQKAGYDLVVYDIRREAAQRHITDGAAWADSPKAVGQQADVVFTSLPGPPEV
ncbi:MAG TPA: NAD(P)-binding domain-containing protein, partial [Chloroflexota bacterium]|nr:NAD(P)-binding domain-containing protein [Chloroflexota bacterium]